MVNEGQLFVLSNAAQQLSCINFSQQKILIMKKLIVPTAALLLFAAASNAQVTQKQPVQAKPVTASHVSPITKPMAAKTTSPTVATTKTPAPAKTNAIHKKHHPKKHKAAAKKG